jgi:hypothetical protein
MHPHPNRLPRWLRTWLMASGAVLLLTGLAWLALHYRNGLETPQQLLPQAWEAPLMRLHGLAMLIFLLCIGALSTIHIPRGWREGRNLKSGLTLLASAALLTASGYALYYFTSEANRSLVGLAHTLVGVLLVLVFALHWRGRYSAKIH